MMSSGDNPQPEQKDPDQETKRPSWWAQMPLRRRIWSVAFLLVFVWIVIEAIDPYRGSWLIRTLFTDSFLIELEADLTVDGQPVRLQRVVKCVTYWSHGNINNPKLFGTKTYRAVETIGKRLSSGAGVMMVVPNICSSRAGSKVVDGQVITGLPPLPDDHLPLIAWTASVDEPTVVEAYVSPSAYSSPSARVAFHELKLHEVGFWRFSDWRDEFEWSRESTGMLGRKASGFEALFSFPISEEDWSHSSTLASYLNQVQKPQYLPKAMAKLVYDLPSVESAGWSSMFSGDGVPPGPLPNGSTTRQGSPGATFDSIIPFRKQGNAFIAAPERRGIALLYPLDAQEPWQIRWDFSISIGDESLEPLAENRDVTTIVYHPGTRLLYLMQRPYTLPATGR